MPTPDDTAVRDALSAPTREALALVADLAVRVTVPAGTYYPLFLTAEQVRLLADWLGVHDDD